MTSSIFTQDSKLAVVAIIEKGFELLASLFGYPRIEGMLFKEPDLIGISQERFASLGMRPNTFPPIDLPQSLIEVFLGLIPRLHTLTRYFYQSDTDGFYNFYIRNYQNIFFLPDWLSEFLQIQLNYCLDISFLEAIRGAVFLCLFIFFELVSLRITLFWFLTINPYTFPWIYVTSAVDWTDEAFQGLVPVVAGLNLTATIVMGIVGALADSLNHLVFTMPFLPSEAEQLPLAVGGQVREVVIFRYFPILWYKYPIPNDIRQYWYYERPDILKFMQESYTDLNVQFLPDEIVQQIKNSQQVTTITDQIISQHSNINNEISTQLLSTQMLIDTHSISHYITHFTDFLHL